MIITVKSATHHDIPAIWDGKAYRLLSSHSRGPSGPRRMVKPWSTANPTIPRSSWKATSRDRKDVPILDQDGIGSCVGHGAATAYMLARSIAGSDFILLSAPFIYAQINGGKDQGADPADAAKVLETLGVCLMSEFPEPNWQKGKIPQSAYTTAKNYTALEIYSCANFDEAVSAFLLGFSCFDTIMVGSSFNNLDSDGVPPRASGPGNHCIAWGDELKLSSKWGWVPQKRNSWTTGWGMAGCYFQSEKHCTDQGQYYECFAVKSPSLLLAQAKNSSSIGEKDESRSVGSRSGKAVGSC